MDSREDIDNLVKQVDKSLKKFKKYDIHIEHTKKIKNNGKTLSLYNPLKYKSKFKYILLPIAVATTLIIFKPNYIYYSDRTNNTKKISKKNMVFAITIISLVIFMIYYFISKNLN